ncbi:MAG: glycosyltransferase family 4 protein [Candidatus Peribacteraceae bacterium]|nr:glycosyltransferase family 4 protein [Candidatus Peribacteraceae bacterium]
MRVCLLTPVLDAFKGGNHLPLLAALPDVQFTIVTSRMKPRNAVLPSNVRCEVIPGRLGPYYYGCVDWLFGRAVLRRYPAGHPFWKNFDVIHLNQTMGPALLKLKKTGVPVCLLIHHPVSADLDVALQESSLLRGLLWRLKYFLLRRWQARLCHEFPVATVSKTAAARIASDYGIHAHAIRIVENGVDTAFFTPKDLSSSEFDAIAIGAFIHPRKGFRYLVDVYRELGKSGLRIADVGRRSAEQQAELAAIPNVRIFGNVPQEELLSLLQRSSVLLSTSLYEGFGLSLIEALACGRPAFAFDAGAVQEVLAPVDPDFVVPLRDSAELVRRVTAFLDLPPDERARKGVVYRESAARLYPLEKSAQALRDLYTMLGGG